MKCSNHPQVEATALCTRCGRALCDECRTDLDGESWCLDCLSVAVHRAFDQRGRWRSSRLAAALLSIIPGAGHMYLGRIGRGFALMAFLFAAIFLIILYSASTGMYWMTAYLIPTLIVLFLSYAVFDSIGIAEHLQAGDTGDEGDDPIMEQIWSRILLNPRAAGYVLVIAGIIGVLDLLSQPVNRFLRETLAIDVPVAAVIIPIALVVIGALFLRRGRSAPR